MRLVWSDAANTMIEVTLLEGETLGHLIGPTDPWSTTRVPADPGNFEYQQIYEQQLPVEPYSQPQEPK